MDSNKAFKTDSHAETHKYFGDYLFQIQAFFFSLTATLCILEIQQTHTELDVYSLFDSRGLFGENSPTQLGLLSPSD